MNSEASGPSSEAASAGGEAANVGLEEATSSADGRGNPAATGQTERRKQHSAKSSAAGRGNPARGIPARGSPARGVAARDRGFWGDLSAVANRSLRQLPRDLASIIPALFVPVFFYAVTIGALSGIANFSALEIDYKAFQLPVAIITTVTGLSRAAALVTDIKDGYFDRLLLTPVNRVSLLLGLMVADLTVFLALCIPVVGMGLIVGVDFPTGFLGVLLFMLMGTLWGLMYTGFPYAIALRTGNPTAVNNSFLLFFPFVFLTTAWLPQDNLSGWLSAVATWNPVSYILEGMRSLFVDWDAAAIGKGLAAILGVGAVAQIFAFMSLRRRVRDP